MQEVEVQIMVDDNAYIPVQAKPGDAGLDLFAKEPFSLRPGEHKLIRTGVRMALPEGYEVQVRPKSGLALKSRITVLNTPGTVDSGYRDEIGVILWRPLNFDDVHKIVTSAVKQALKEYDQKKNLDDINIDFTNPLEPYHFEKGDKIAQIVFAQYASPKFITVDNLPESERGTGGFGHTGR